MTILSLIFIFLFGTIIGSFLNVIIYRLNTGRTIAKGRSMCMSCGRNLRWYELIPVLSFIIQCGKCRRCKSPISCQYPIVEFFIGLVFVLIAFKFLPIIYIYPYLYVFYVAFFAFIFSLLTVIFVYDLRHKIIPDKLVYTFIILSFVSIFINFSAMGPVFILPDVYSFIAGPIIAIPFILLWYISKGKLMGLGDAKLMLGMGFLLGLSSGIFAVIVSFWIGTIVSIPLMLLSKSKMNMKTEVPFAPFLIICTLITFFFSLDMFSMIRLFSI